MASDDRNYKAAKKVILQAAAVYLPSYTMGDDNGNFTAAEKMLAKYNLGISVWPAGGGKQTSNTLDLSVYKNPIPHKKEAYIQLRKDVNALLKPKVTGYPFLVPIVFCQFDASGAGITPHSSKLALESPLCLISASGARMNDKMTVLHEMGHSALWPDPNHDDDSTHKGNLMQEADGRTFLLRSQVEAFEHAFFARTPAISNQLKDGS